MDAIVRLLPLPARRAATPERLRLMGQFIRFGTVGTLGFVWDIATVYASAPYIGLYAAGLLAYVVAASINWLLNRMWTFRGSATDQPARQWLRFLAANFAGFGLNRGVYVALIAGSATARTDPVLAVAAGSLAGLFANFFLSRRYVYR